MKEFFTFDRLFWTVIYDAVLIGVVTSIVLFRVNVLGLDAKIDPAAIKYHDE
jgi:hypothetical protein